MYVPKRYSLYRDTSSCYLIITKNVMIKLLHYQQNDESMTEAGGFLIGRHLLQTNDRVIDQLTTPTIGDKRCFSKFYRSNIHNHILYDKWLTSEKTQTLLGLWHTHPESSPTPSIIDSRDWEQAIHDGNFIGDSLVFLIVGNNEIRIWEGFRTGHFNEIHIES